MKLYGIPNCTTVKKARDWLTQNDIAYEFHNFKKEGLSQELLTHWLEQLPWEKLVNRAGMTWRNLSDAEKAAVINPSSALILMRDKTSVIKRPLLVKDGKIICLGFSEESYHGLFQANS